MAKDYCCPKCGKDLRSKEDYGIEVEILQRRIVGIGFDKKGKFEEADEKDVENIGIRCYCNFCYAKLELDEKIWDKLPKKIKLA